MGELTLGCEGVEALFGTAVGEAVREAVDTYLPCRYTELKGCSTASSDTQSTSTFPSHTQYSTALPSPRPLPYLTLDTLLTPLSTHHSAQVTHPQHKNV